MHHAVTYETARVTVWPSPQDYNEAVQNLSTSFSDPVLKHGEPELSPMGLPKPISGAFASVYRIRTGQGDWALRCFLRKMSDQQERYDRISQHLEGVHQPHTLEFDYQPEGLLCHGRQFPILKMKWAEGLHLDQYVAANLNQLARLDALCVEWKVMLRWLQKNGIAHGDLQHGNVLVDGGQLMLVDYDGMFVPSLAGLSSNELGHRNYQHPARSKEHFGPWLDNFAAWSIFTSLCCLRADPSLWRKLHGGDECLLFHREDYIDPIHSRAFYLLEQHSSDHVRDCARLFRSFLYLPIEKVPDLDAGVQAPLNLAVLKGPAGASSATAQSDDPDSQDNNGADQESADDSPWYINPVAGTPGLRPATYGHSQQKHKSTQATPVAGAAGQQSAAAQAVSGQVKKGGALLPLIMILGMTVFTLLVLMANVTELHKQYEAPLDIESLPLSSNYARSDGTLGQLQPFSRVIVNGPGKFQIEVEGQTLPKYAGAAVIEQKKDWLKVSASTAAPVRLITGKLDTIYVRDADVTVKGLSTPLLRICLAGSGKFTAAGLVKEARIDVPDNATAMLNGLEIQRRADVIIRKNGLVKINITGDLHCMVATDGKLLYKTQPESIVRETKVGYLQRFFISKI
jgi:hypothetical protein